MTVAIKINANDGKTRNVMTGGETEVDFDFPIYDDDHINIFKTDVAGAISLLVKTTDYTVPAASVDAQAGGVVNLVVAAVAGEVYTAFQAAPYQRISDFNQAGDFFADVLNKELDLITQQIQQVIRDLARAPLLREDSEVASVILPDPSDNKVLAWDGLTGQLKNAEGSISSSVTANGGNTSREIVNKLGDVLSIYDFGAVGGGVVDDSAAFVAAAASGKYIIIPKDTFKLVGTFPFATGTIFDVRGATFNINLDGDTTRGFYFNGITDAFIIGSGYINHELESTAATDGSYNNAVTFGPPTGIGTPTITPRCGIVGNFITNSVGSLNSKAVYGSGYVEDIFVKGVRPSGQSNFAIVFHWTQDTTLATLPTKTWHPHNIFVSDCGIKDDGNNNTLRGLTFSACGHVVVDRTEIIDCPTLGFNLFVGDFGYTYAQNIDSSQAFDFTLNDCVSASPDGGLLSIDGISTGYLGSPVWNGADHNAKVTLNDFKATLKSGGDEDAIGITGLSLLQGNIQYIEETTGQANNPMLLTSVKTVNLTGEFISQEDILIRDCDKVNLDIKCRRITETHNSTSENIGITASSEDVTVDGAISVGGTSVVIDSATLVTAAGGILQYDDAGTIHEMNINSIIDSNTLTFSIDPSTVAIPDGATVTIIQTVRSANLFVDLAGARTPLKLDGTVTAKPRNINVKGCIQRAGLVDIDAEYVDGFDFDISSDHGGKTTTTTTTYGVLLQDGAENGTVKYRAGKNSKGVKFPVFCQNSCGPVSIDDCVFPVAGSTSGSKPITKGSSGNVRVGSNNLFGSGVTAVEGFAEGDWTPEYEAASGSPTITHGSRSGYFTKVGRLVTVWGNIQTTAFTAAGSADMRITGLPYTSSNTSSRQYVGNCTRANDFQSNSNPDACYVNENTDYIILTRKASADAGAETNAVLDENDMGTGASDNEVQFCIQYLTDE